MATERLEEETFNELRKQEKISMVILIYVLLCHAPYFVPALNQIEPKIAGIPFTVYSILFLVFLCCVLLLWLGNNVWDSYDGKEEE